MGIIVNRQLNCGQSSLFDSLPKARHGFRVRLVEVLIPKKAEYARGVEIQFGCGVETTDGAWDLPPLKFRPGVFKIRKLTTANGDAPFVPSAGGLWLSAVVNGRAVTDALIVANVRLESI